MKPFQRSSIPQSEIDGAVEATRRDFEADPAGYRKRWRLPVDAPLALALDMVRSVASDEVFVNDCYQVNLRPVDAMPGSNLPPMVHLSIKRLDKGPIRDWRDMQRIKNDLVGPECEGCELYPAESRVVDTANQFHLWVFTTPKARFPFGFSFGVKTNGGFANSKQRPL